VANAVVHTKEPLRLTERNVGADMPCVVHQGSTTHTNSECSKQIELRAKISPDKVYGLIEALTLVVNSTLAERQRARAEKNKRREQLKNEKQKTEDGAGNRPKSDAPAHVKKRKADKQAALDSKSNHPFKRFANDSTSTDDLKGRKQSKTSKSDDNNAAANVATSIDGTLPDSNNKDDITWNVDQDSDIPMNQVLGVDDYANYDPNGVQ
jgi:hypothetical protein